MTFTVYALADPRTEEARYVGLTSRGTKSRAWGHWTARGTDDHPKNVWLRDLDAAGLRPTVSTLETAETMAEGVEAEYHWIEHFDALGAPLTNIQRRPVPITKPEPFDYRQAMANTSAKYAIEVMVEAKFDAAALAQMAAFLIDQDPTVREAVETSLRYARPSEKAAA